MTSPNGTTELHELVLPVMTNHHGTLFAGQGLQLMAKAAFLAARNLAQREIVMAGVSGIDFMAPVPVDSRLRARIELMEATPIEGGMQMAWKCTVEREGSDKPVCVAESLSRSYL